MSPIGGVLFPRLRGCLLSVLRNDWLAVALVIKIRAGSGLQASSKAATASQLTTTIMGVA